MNFLPIVARELRVMSRREWLYWIRVAFAAVGMVAAVLMFYEGSRRHGQGEEMLWLLSAVTMLLALVSGSLFTADCISSEKREDTLGFLFLTNLKGYDIVAGKIAISAITTTAGLLAMFPVFFLPLLAGGVTWAETVRVLLSICVSFLFTLSFGVWVSTRSIEARNAAVAVLATMFLLVVLPMLWIAALDEFFNIRPSLLGVPQLSPGMLLYFCARSLVRKFRNKIRVLDFRGYFFHRKHCFQRVGEQSVAEGLADGGRRGKHQNATFSRCAVGGRARGVAPGESVFSRQTVRGSFTAPQESNAMGKNSVAGSTLYFCDDVAVFIRRG